VEVLATAVGLEVARDRLSKQKRSRGRADGGSQSSSLWPAARGEAPLGGNFCAHEGGGSYDSRRSSGGGCLDAALHGSSMSKAARWG
jgi:putative hemolysin